MINPTNSGPLLYCHIPKCGGTSLRSIIKSEYLEKERYFLYKGELKLAGPDKKFIEKFKVVKRQVKIIFGHFSFGVHKFLDVPPLYATIIREPVSRVVSTYYHISRDPSSPFFKYIKSGISLKEFVSTKITGITNNHMTRILAGRSDDPSFLNDEKEWIDEAKYNIENYFCVIGTLEGINNVVRNLGNLMEWKNYRIPKLNEAPLKKGILDKDTRNIILEFNQLDQMLYDWVKNFEQDYLKKL